MLHTRWLPILLAVMMADLNFWYFASVGENHADWGGLALFAFFAACYALSFARRRDAFSAVAGLGALLAAVLMALREAGLFDLGYIPPYAVFIAFVLAASVGRRRKEA
ncbi:MAG TPA: hypothetical protein VFA98_10020 [Thermoanaerobaculia bacterium]|nr:hypothetical protein [Thermoanaerobaculia bacterium]